MLTNISDCASAHTTNCIDGYQVLSRQLEAITAITSPLASPANGLSPLEMMAASSCPAHLAPAPHITTTHMVNGPVFHHGMQHATQHSTIQHSVNFGLPPPPPPPPIGNVKANQVRAESTVYSL